MNITTIAKKIKLPGKEELEFKMPDGKSIKVKISTQLTIKDMSQIVSDASDIAHSLNDTDLGIEIGMAYALIRTCTNIEISDDANIEDIYKVWTYFDLKHKIESCISYNTLAMLRISVVDNVNKINNLADYVNENVQGMNTFVEKLNNWLDKLNAIDGDINVEELLGKYLPTLEKIVRIADVAKKGK